MNHLSELFHNTNNFDETQLPGRVSLEEQKRQTAKLLCQDAFDQELERIYQGPALLVGNGHPVHYLLVCGEGEARNRQVELLLSALYQNGRIHSQRATWKAYDYDDRVDRDLLDSLYQASSGGAMVLSYNPESGTGSRRASAGLEVVMELCRAIRNYQSQTLTVLCLSPEGEATKKLFYENLGPLTFVELREDVVAVAGMSDGLFRTFGQYGLERLEEWMAGATFFSALALCDRMRVLEASDPNLERFPRMKLGDDASLFWLGM